MIHDLETTAHGERYHHKCRRCGIEKTTTTAKWFAACKGPPCVHLGPAAGETVTCEGCKGEVQIKTFACAVHGCCLPHTGKDKPTTPAVHKCQGCGDRMSAP